jgi:hypothetical protein
LVEGVLKSSQGAIALGKSTVNALGKGFFAMGTGIVL